MAIKFGVCLCGNRDLNGYSESSKHVCRYYFSKGFLLKGFKCTVYRFSAKLKLKVMGVSCGEYFAALPGNDKVVSVACLRYFGRVKQIYEN